MLVKQVIPLELIRCVSSCLSHRACRHVHAMCVPRRWQLLHGLCFMICLLAARAAVASHKCHSRVRHFGRVFVLPYRSSPLCGLSAVEYLVCMSLWPVWSTFLSRKSAFLTAQTAKFFWPRRGGASRPARPGFPAAFRLPHHFAIANGSRTE